MAATAIPNSGPVPNVGSQVSITFISTDFTSTVCGVLEVHWWGTSREEGVTRGASASSADALLDPEYWAHRSPRDGQLTTEQAPCVASCRKFVVVKVDAGGGGLLDVVGTAPIVQPFVKAQCG